MATAIPARLHLPSGRALAKRLGRAVHALVWSLVPSLRRAHREGQLAEQRHLLDVDTGFAAMSAAHPEACSHDTDYPGWTPGGAA